MKMKKKKILKCVLYVYCYINKMKINDNELPIESKKQFNKFFNFHRDNIEEINKEDPLDGIIFVYSGHGSNGSIIGCTGKEMLIQTFFWKYF